MASSKFIKLTVKLDNSNETTLYLGAGNFSVEKQTHGVCIKDAAAAKDGWMLHASETYENVVRRIDNAMRESEMLPRLPAVGIKD